MAKNTQNLVSISERSTDEAREISRKGGIKSGESRRRKRTIRDTMELLLVAPMSADETAELEKLGLDCIDLDRRAMLAVGIYKKAVEGDSKAFTLISKMIHENSQTQEEKEQDEKDRAATLDLLRSLTE